MINSRGIDRFTESEREEPQGYIMINSRCIDRITESKGKESQSYIIFEGEELSSECKKISPDKDKIVILQGKDEWKKELEKKIEYLNENNFRLQIGKMQEDIETIYSNNLLRCGISYILKHVEKDENSNRKVIIQLWPTLAQKLLQQETGKIINYNEEKGIIQKIINNFGKTGKYIEIQNVADNYPDVFAAIKKGKQGIIPSKEPTFNELNKTLLDKTLKSPLPIIKYLAYHCQQDQKLMQLFYNTKPEKYKKQDEQNLLHAGDSNADYYSIVEVGIRLCEILNGIHIQGGIDRQKVYDKIIGLILFGKDNISEENKKLNIQDYTPLEKLHQWISDNFGNVRMEQLYIYTDKLDGAIKDREKEYENRKKEYEKKKEEDEREKKDAELQNQLSKNTKQIEILKQQKNHFQEKNEKIKSFLKNQLFDWV